jgi:hypothetical protein
LRTGSTAVLVTLLINLIPLAAQTERQFNSDEDGRKITYGAETDFNSAYAWRGIVLNSRPVMQPSLWISAYGTTLTAWGNLALTNSSGSPRLQTTDLILAHGCDWKRLKIESTLEAYLNRRPGDIDGRNTMEGSLKLSYTAGRFRIFTIQSFDILTYKGSYFGEAGLGYERRIAKKTELAVSFHSGWASSKFNDVYIGLDKPAFNFIGLESSLTHYVRPHLYFRPHFEFSNITGRQLREYLSSPAFAAVGLAMGFEF